jgi:hypothetical protein
MDELQEPMDMIALLVLPFAVLMAYGEAHRDFEAIRDHTPINHVRRWLERSVRLGLVGAILALFMDRPLAMAPLLFAGAFLFSGVFRWKLNGLRGMRKCYIAPWSNWYDRVFYALACLTWWTKAELRSHEIIMRDYERSMIVSGYEVHRAGRLAYFTEAVLCVAFVGLSWWL